MAECNQNQKVIDSAPKKVNEYKDLVTKTPKTGLAGVRDALSNYLLKAKEAVDVESHYKRLQSAAEQWAKHIINLIVIFLLQTLIIPVMLIWIVYEVVKSAFLNNFKGKI